MSKAHALLEVLDRFLANPAVNEKEKPVRKAKPDDFWRRLHAVADAQAPALRRAVLEAVATTASGMNQNLFEQALAQGDFERATRMIPWKELGEPSLRAAYQTILGEVFEQAGNVTADQLGQDLDAAVSFDRTNPRAARWAEQVAGTRVREVSETTVDGIRNSIRRGFDEGLHPYETARLMRGPNGDDGLYRHSLIGLTEHQSEAVWNYREALQNDEVERSQEREDRMVERYRDELVLSRAETIARTETIRASGEGQQELWRQAREQGSLRGDEKREWIATEDDRGCETCLALDGTVVGIDEEFDDPFDEFDPVLVPPIHPNCFLPGTIVCGAFVAGLKARYAGPAVELETRNGHRLSVTPNHPVLTPRGWIPAGEVRKGDYTLSQARIAEVLDTVGCSDDQHGPATVEEVFESLSAYGTSSHQVCSLDLHGDAVFTDRNVEVVGSDAEVGSRADAVQFKGLDKFEHVLSDVREFSGHRLGVPDLSGQGNDHASAPLPSRSHLSLDESPIALQERPLEPLRFGLATHLDAILKEDSSEHVAAHTAFIAQLLEGCSGQIALDKVIRIRQFDFSGHVYDLQSVNGWIIAQNIVTSNCRCATGLVLVEDQDNTET